MPDDGAKILTEQREPTAANGSYNIQAFVVPLIVVGVLLVVAIALWIWRCVYVRRPEVRQRREQQKAAESHARPVSSSFMRTPSAAPSIAKPARPSSFVVKLEAEAKAKEMEKPRTRS